MPAPRLPGVRRATGHEEHLILRVTHGPCSSPLVSCGALRVSLHSHTLIPLNHILARRYAPKRRRPPSVSAMRIANIWSFSARPGLRPSGAGSVKLGTQNRITIQCFMVQEKTREIECISKSLFGKICLVTLCAKF